MQDDRPTFGSLFAGIGGIDLGLERAGWRGRWQVEWDPFCQRVLAKHWPDVIRYGDITTVDWSGVERVDLLAGGFPCQPVSAAGLQAAQEDARWLWPEFLRAIRALRPRLILVENVTNILAINGGSAFGEVVGDLAACGYDAEWDCIPAASVGAVHERDRVWIVAYPAGDRRSIGWIRDEGRDVDSTSGQPVRSESVGDGPGGGAGSVANAARNGRNAWRPGHTPQESQRWQPHRGRVDGSMAYADGNAPGWPSIPRPERHHWRVEPDVGRVAHGVPSRVDRLRSLGNAVVPQVVEVIGRQLMDAIR